MIKNLRNIIISRTDSIGDVVLTLPMAGVLKRYLPDIKIGFMGKAYTQAVIEACAFVDCFINVDDFYNGTANIFGQKPQAILHVLPVAGIAKQAKKLHIPLRIGTTNRLYHWFTCNKLVKLSRKKSNLHEAQLNVKLLAALGIHASFTLTELYPFFGLTKLKPLLPQFAKLLSPTQYNLIIHAKSQGSAREWPLDNFATLVGLLGNKRFNLLISGTDKEKAALQPLLDGLGGEVTDITGKMDLAQFMAFIQAADGLIAGSTGPLHIAAALGKDAFGLFVPMRPIHPGRWQPIGPGAQVFVAANNCIACRNNADGCKCIMEINPQIVKSAIEEQAVSFGK